MHTCAVACLHASVCAHRGCSWTVCAIGTWHGPGRGTNAWCCPLDSSQRASPPLQCVRARATGPLCGALRSERPWALVRLNAPTSPYHSIGCGRDAPMRRTPDAELCTPTNTCVWSEPGWERRRRRSDRRCMLRIEIPLSGTRKRLRTRASADCFRKHAWAETGRAISPTSLPLVSTSEAWESRLSRSAQARGQSQRAVCL